MSLLSRLFEASSLLAFLLSCISLIIVIIYFTNVINNNKLSSYSDGANNLCTIEQLLTFKELYDQDQNSQHFEKLLNVCSIVGNTSTVIHNWIVNKARTRDIVNYESAHTMNDRTTPVSVHKQLKPHDVKSDLEQQGRSEVKEHFTLKFDTETLTPLTEHVRGSQITNDGIRILYAGLYYIYSNVGYKRNSFAHQNKSNHKTWHTYLHRVSPNRPWNSGVLLRSVYTPCTECPQLEESHFIGGVFHLHQGDIIQICLSNPDIDNFNRQTSFVGLFKLAS